MVIRLPVAVLVVLAVLAPAARAQELRVFTIAGGGTPFAREGMRATSASLGPIDVAVRPDGTILVSSYSVVWQVTDRSRLRRVIGGTKSGRERDGGPARDSGLIGSVDLAEAPDGGILLGEHSGCGVRRIGPDGVVTRVAGRRPPTPSAPCWISGEQAPDVGDGGPALDALIGAANGVSATSDGGYLVADATLNRVRRVSSDGTITTAAGRGGSWYPGMPPPPYSGAAADAALGGPTDVAALPGGGFLFTDSAGLHEVGSDGSIRTVQPSVPTGGHGLSVLGLSETGLAFGALVKGESRPNRFQLLGSPPFDMAFGAQPGYFTGDGDVLEQANIETLTDIEPLPDGGFLLASEDRVRAALPAGTERLGVAIGRESLPTLARRRVMVRTTVPAAIEIEVYSKGKLLERVERQAHRGLNALRLPRGVPPDLYTLRVVATTPQGASASNRLRAIVGPRLPIAAAMVAAEGVYWAPYAADEYPYPIVSRCHRFGARRVDCRVGEGGSYDGNTACQFVAAARLARSGILYARSYACPGRGGKLFKRSPRWSGKWKAAAPL